VFAVELFAVEGPAGFLLQSPPDAGDEVHAAALVLSRAVGSRPGVREMSSHPLGVGVVP